ncbi:MAG: methyltransferase regulatory domain-containing protein [Alphaproteobacteria bacterium]|nr:methyltransferase regulatory domain-containing protein [Alphaproteobacteria bacterium]MBU2377554.1 methyltransferase regulatory domain-containing protein [Alphaproteobacteria bacterium]
MSDWTSGYVADVEYTTGYFTELNPVRFPIGLLNAGYAPPRIENACELGFGQGMSIAMHAAAQPHVNWFGDDFNPDHVLFARWLNDSAGASADLTDESFEQFCKRDDLPMFDSIGLHGIWSWVTPQNRDIIVDFINRKLNVGGVVYCSYNVMPGWATAAPIRELLAMHARMTAGKGMGSGEKMEAALTFVGEMFDRDPVFLAANPQARDKFEQLKTMPRGYLSHEYMNTSWYPMYFNDIADIFGEAKLEFACSASYQEAVEEIQLTAPQRAWLAGIDNEPFRETMRDFMRNNQFRKDYWVKGGFAMPQAERIERIRDVRIVLLNVRANIPETAASPLGEVTLAPEVYGPLLDFLADNRPHAIRDIEIALQDKGVQFGQVLQAVMLLAGSGHLGFAQSDAQIAAARPRTRKMNTVLMQRAELQDGLSYLASPVTGGAIAISRIDQMFLKGWIDGLPEPRQWADKVWQVLEQSGHRALKDGKPVETSEENREAIAEAADKFQATLLPLFQGLEIAVREKSSPVGRKGAR